MKRHIKETLIGIIMIPAIISMAMLSLPALSETGTFAAYAAEKTVAAPASVTVLKASEASLKISWSKVKGAAGYLVYRYDAATKKYQKIKTLGADKSTWTDAKRKSNTTYWYKVMAYSVKDGVKSYSPYSYTVSARPYTSKAKAINAQSISVDYNKRSLGLNQVSKVHAAVNASKGKKALSTALMWTSSDPSVVTVTKSGWLQAQGSPGAAKITIRAHNGTTKTMAITVADYAHPAAFTNLEKVRKWSPRTVELLQTYQQDLGTVAAYLERYKSEREFYYADDEIQFVGSEIDLASIEAELLRLLKDEGLSIRCAQGEITFTQTVDPLKSNAYTPIIGYADSDGPADEKRGDIKIAPCWYFFSGANSF